MNSNLKYLMFLLEKKIRTQTSAEERSSEDPGRRGLSVSQRKGPQKKPALLTT